VVNVEVGPHAIRRLDKLHTERSGPVPPGFRHNRDAADSVLLNRRPLQPFPLVAGKAILEVTQRHDVLLCIKVSHAYVVQQNDPGRVAETEVHCGPGRLVRGGGELEADKAFLRAY